MSGHQLVPDRAILRVSGSERLHFLDGLLTASIADLEPGALRYGALLTPQGKIVSDMLIFGEEEAVALDVPADAIADLKRRLTMYKLRAAVDLEEPAERPAVGVEGGAPDPRHPSLGTRALVATDQDDAVGSGALKRFVAARIAAGVPEGSLDFALGDTFPHDANMDLTGGIDFAKGCFVGQEVVSRMRHRGTARRRTVRVEAQSDTLPPTGSPILAGETAVGTLGTAQGREGLAIVRIDRTGKGPLTCAGVAITLTVPPGAPFVLAEAS